MRGSPLKRALVVAVILIAAGFGLVQLTEPPKPELIKATPRTAEEQAGKPGGEMVPARIRISLSVVPSAIVLKVGDDSVGLVRNPQGEYEGATILDTSGQVIFLTVKPETPSEDSDTQVFAKVVIEPDQHDAITHVFNAKGEIDDFLELKF
jgi:hypothetical protein